MEENVSTEPYLENDEGILYDDYFDECLWVVKPVYIKREPPRFSNGSPYDSYGEVVQLQWGWTAASTKEELKQFADDAPTGFNSLTIQIEDAVCLYRELGSLLRKHGVIKNSRELLAENQKLRSQVNQLSESALMHSIQVKEILKGNV